MGKLLFIVTKSRFGGAQRYVFDLAKEAKQRGFDAKVAFGGQGLLTEMCEEAKISTISIKNLERDLSFAKELSAFFELVKILDREKPDAIHLNSSKAGGLGALAGRVAGVKKIIFTAHGLPHFERRSLLARKAFAFFTWLSMALATDTIVISKHDLKAVKKWPFVRGKTHYIPNGIKEFEALGRTDSRQMLAKKNPEILSKDILLGSIAELTPNKGVLFAIRALETFLKEKNAGFLIIGDGEQWSEIREAVKERGLENFVFMAGFMDNAKKYLKAFDLFLLPSFKEGLPYALLEARLAGVPAVASKVGGVPDILSEESLFEPGDKNSLVGTLKNALGDKGALADDLHKKVSTEFSFERMADSTIALYSPKL